MSAQFSRLLNSPVREEIPPKAKSSLQHEVIEISTDDEDDYSGDGSSSSSSIEFSPHRKRGFHKTSSLNHRGLKFNFDDLASIQFGPRPPLRNTKYQIKRQKLEDINSFRFDDPPATDQKREETLWETFRNTYRDHANHKATDEDTIANEFFLQDGVDEILHSHQPGAGSVDENTTLKHSLQFEDNHKSNGNLPQTLARSEQLRAAPFYDDESLLVISNNSMLTRDFTGGPGYEKFPIVLGTRKEHQTICDKWTRKMTSKSPSLRQSQAFFSAMDSSTTGLSVGYNDNETDGNEEESEENPAESACLSQVLTILPDIEHEFVLQTIRARIRCIDSENTNDDSIIWPGADEVVAVILEKETYPMQEIDEEEASDGTGKTIKYKRQNEDIVRYLSDTVIILASQFEYIPTNFIHKTVHEKRNLFDAFKQLHAIETEYPSVTEKPYRRLRTRRTVLEKKYTSLRAIDPSSEEWKHTVNELQAAKQSLERENIRLQHEKELLDQETANLQYHIDHNDCFECQCCFDEKVPNNRAVVCNGVDEIHSFCYSCVKSLAENQMGMMKYDLLCMDGSGCKAQLSSPGILQAVPPKIIDKLAYYQQQAEITAANIEGLEQCHFCDFKAICDSVEIEPNFNCLNTECGRAACRKCHEEPHGTKSCEDAKVDKGLSVRHVIEEARSEAMMRPCPKCNVKIVKLSGCNKILCTRCGCVICFVCKKDISDKREGGYQHFHGPGAKCSLHDRVDFDRHDHDANEAEKEAIKKARAQNTDLDETQLQIEIGKDESKASVSIQQPRVLPPARNAPRARRHRHHAVRPPLYMTPMPFVPYDPYLIPGTIPQATNGANPDGIVNPTMEAKQTDQNRNHNPNGRPRMPRQPVLPMWQVDGNQNAQVPPNDLWTRPLQEWTHTQTRQDLDEKFRQLMENMNHETRPRHDNLTDLGWPYGEIPHVGGGLTGPFQHQQDMMNFGPMQLPSTLYPAIRPFTGPGLGFEAGQAVGHHAYGALIPQTFNQTFINQNPVNLPEPPQIENDQLMIPEYLLRGYPQADH